MIALKSYRGQGPEDNLMASSLSMSIAEQLGWMQSRGTYHPIPAKRRGSFHAIAHSALNGRALSLDAQKQG